MKIFLASARCYLGILYASISFITPGSSDIKVVGPIYAKERDVIILPCYLEPMESVEYRIVEWTRTDLKTKKVHLYKDGKDSVADQIPDYRTRTSLFKDDLKTGNMSLKLFGAKLSDTGIYTCRLLHPTTEATIQLIVDATDFLRAFKNDLIKNITNVMSIVNELVMMGLLEEKVQYEISQTITSPNQMELLYKYLEVGNVKMKSAFYSLLQIHEPVLLSKLENLKQQLEELDAVDFVTMTKETLIQRITNVTPIADRLLSKGLIQESDCIEINEYNTSEQKMRLLFLALEKSGSEFKPGFYRILLEYEPALVKELGDLLRIIREKSGVSIWSRWEVAVLIICLLTLQA